MATRTDGWWMCTTHLIVDWGNINDEEPCIRRHYENETDACRWRKVTVCDGWGIQTGDQVPEGLRNWTPPACCTPTGRSPRQEANHR